MREDSRTITRPEAVPELRALTWEEARDLAGGTGGAVALLPVGAVEAHGPHLPLATDVIIAEAMARSGGARLGGRGLAPVLLPPLAYTTADFAAGFPGTVSIRPETASALLVDIARSLTHHGFRVLAVANAHLDPTHLAALHAARSTCREEALLPVAFPDITRKPWATRLTEEFRSGACHAGQYETSVVLAEAPEQVRAGLAAGLAPNPRSLATAIRAGQRSFEAAGGPRAYFGDPAAATAEGGRHTIEVLGAILEEAVMAELEEQT